MAMPIRKGRIFLSFLLSGGLRKRIRTKRRHYRFPSVPINAGMWAKMKIYGAEKTVKEKMYV